LASVYRADLPEDNKVRINGGLRYFDDYQI